MAKQLTRQQRLRLKARRERIFKLFDWGVGLPLTIFLLLWLVGGSITTLLAVFAGSALTLGLIGWPIGIIGFGVTFGVTWLVYTVFTSTADRLKSWVAEAERDPEREASMAKAVKEFRESLAVRIEDARAKGRENLQYWMKVEAEREHRKRFPSLYRK